MSTYLFMYMIIWIVICVYTYPYSYVYIYVNIYRGKDAASARYVFTKLESITRCIYHPDDDPLLLYQVRNVYIYMCFYIYFSFVNI
jgi:hypothetical protein